MRLWEEDDHTGTWYHPLHIATSVYWLDCVQICKDARLTMQSAAKLKYCTSIVMRLIHELHVLELQIEMNMYDRRSFSACSKREFFRPFSLRSYTFSKYCALHGKNLSTSKTHIIPLWPRNFYLNMICRTAAWHEEATWWKACRPADVYPRRKPDEDIDATRSVSEGVQNWSADKFYLNITDYPMKSAIHPLNNWGHKCT